MKKYLILVLFTVFNITSAQTIDQLMQGYDNLYALEHIELFTKPQNKVDYSIYGDLAPPKHHRSLKIINVDASWLENITNLVEQNPAILYPYLDSDTQNLAAYILLLHSLDINMPEGNSYKEDTCVNLLKEDIFNPDFLPKFKQYKNTPVGQDPAKYILNTIWKNIVVQGANTRLKTIIENL